MFKCVQTFIYLGSRINEANEVTEEFKKPEYTVVRYHAYKYLMKSRILD